MSPLTRLTGASSEERLRYGQMVKSARLGMGMSQDDLAKAAAVARKTISNIERGTHAGQEDVLRRIFAVVGIPTAEDAHSDEVLAYMEMFGTIMENIAPEDRLEAQNRTMMMLTEFVRRNTTPKASNVTQFPAQSTPVEMTEEEELKYAADESPVEDEIFD